MEYFAHADDINREIDRGVPSWSFAKNKENQGKLNDMVLDCRGKMSEMQREYLACADVDSSKLKKKYSQEEVITELTKFSNMQDEFEEINGYLRLLVRRQQLEYDEQAKQAAKLKKKKDMKATT